MGWSVGRHSEPNRKLGTLDRRIDGLRGVVKRSEGEYHVARAAERVRPAALALIKAKQALIREYPDCDPTGRQSEHLLAERSRLVGLSVDGIVREFARPEDLPPAGETPEPDPG